MEYIIRVGKAIVWEGHDKAEAFKVRDAIVAAREGAYNLSGDPKVYELANESSGGW
jgi:hypothetical protein